MKNQHVPLFVSVAFFAFTFINVVFSSHSCVAADDFSEEAKRKATDQYEKELQEIKAVAKQRKAEAKERWQRALKPIEEFEEKKKKNEKRYRGMLGSYFNRNGRIPFICLSVPRERNVLGEYAQSVFNGNYDATLQVERFEAHGHVVIPNDGMYLLETSRGYGNFKLNEMDYMLRQKEYNLPPNAQVQLSKGVYDVYFSIGNNGGQLPGATVRIIDLSTEQELPVFVYKSEVKEFVNDLSLGVKLLETSKWDFKENELTKKKSLRGKNQKDENQ